MSRVQENGILAFVRPCENNIYVTTVDQRNGRVIKEMAKVGSCKKFVSEIPKLFKKNVKAVVLNLFTFEPTPHFANNYEFCKAIKAKLDLMKMRYAFICDYQYLCASVLTVTKVTVDIGETVLIVLVNENGIHVMELKYTVNGYTSNAETRVFQYNPSESHESIRQRIIGSATPKKIIIFPNAQGYPILKQIKSILKFKELFITEDDLIPYDGKVVAEMVKHIYDEKYTKFWIIPNAAFGYVIRMTTGNKSYDLLYFLGSEELPAKRELVLAKQNFNFSFIARNAQFKREELIETFTLPMNCHRVKLILSIDSNNFASYKIEPEIIPKIKLLPEFLHRSVPSKAPVIGFFGNSSVICYHKNGKYQFLDGWNGVYGKDLLISFATKKPTFNEDAVEALRTKPSHVVLDLMRIASMPVTEIKHNGPWNFTFTKDADHPLLIEFDKADGSRGAAAPAFLMAMQLKEHLKALKDETGEKPTDIVFCLLDDYYSIEERVRIDDEFREACKLLKINISILFYFLLVNKI